MALTIDIDTGGTFTDGVFQKDGELHWLKVDTTPHDLTVCFAQCMEKGRSILGLATLEEMLGQTDVVRFSTTIGTNALIQRSGPKLGVLVSSGHEQTLYHSDSPFIWDTLIDPKLVVGVGRADSHDIVRKLIKYLLDQGAQSLVVSLAIDDPKSRLARERELQSMIYEDYPPHYLGSVPILLGSQLTDHPDHGMRTRTALLNAYLHKDLVRYLYKAEDFLRENGYRKPLLIGHGTGGCARVAKTKAIETYNSGPTAGLLGVRNLMSYFEQDTVLTFDVGGTSTDIGVIQNGHFNYDRFPLINGVQVDQPLIEVRGLGIAGGSIARVDADRRLTVGPDSAGALPGPACYDTGGLEPTVTDAFVVVRLIDPMYFLGGDRPLNATQAYQAIEEWIAKPLDLGTEAAAWNIIEVAVREVCSGVHAYLQSLECDPSALSLATFGGGGGLLGPLVADVLDINTIVSAPFSSVLSAFGSSTLDVRHMYRAHIDIGDSTMAELTDRAFIDMRGEGFDSSGVTLNWYDQADVFGQSLDPSTIQRGDYTLVAEAPVPHVTLAVDELCSEAAPVDSHRIVFWNGEYLDIPVYKQENLRPGMSIRGLAVIERKDSTDIVPPQWRASITRHGVNLLTRG